MNQIYNTFTLYDIQVTLSHIFPPLTAAIYSAEYGHSSNVIRAAQIHSPPGLGLSSCLGTCVPADHCPGIAIHYERGTVVRIG